MDDLTNRPHRRTLRLRTADTEGEEIGLTTEEMEDTDATIVEAEADGKTIEEEEAAGATTADPTAVLPHLDVIETETTMIMAHADLKETPLAEICAEHKIHPSVRLRNVWRKFAVH